MKFLTEYQIFQEMSAHQMTVPKHALYGGAAHPPMPFVEGEEVVIKGIADQLWHKTEQQVLFFTQWQNNDEFLADFQRKIAQRLANYQQVEMLVCEKVLSRRHEQMPHEFFLSLKQEENYGMVLRIGIGGVAVENWATHISVLEFPLAFYRPSEMLVAIEAHFVGQVLFGYGRGLVPLITPACFLAFLLRCCQLAQAFHGQLELLEINPWVVDLQGEIVPLDGVGLLAATAVRPVLFKEDFAAALFRPQKIALMGVAARADAFGRIILANLQASGGNPITVLRSGGPLAGLAQVNWMAQLSELAADPHDLLILALPAAAALAAILQLCELGGGAEVVYIVAGVTGEEATLLEAQLTAKLQHLRSRGQWTPAIIGPNGIGMVLAQPALNSLFIPPAKLPVKFCHTGKIALISQSGALLLTGLLAETPPLELRSTICVGNQIDITISQVAGELLSELAIDVVLIYLESWRPQDLLRMQAVALAAHTGGKKIIVYRGGQSVAGQNAAAGHTGALAANVLLEQKLLAKMGILVAQRFDQFWNLARLYQHYPSLARRPKIWAISNAGFETVLCADRLGKGFLAVPTFKAAGQEQLQALLQAQGLERLVHISNPMDVTPMASEEMFLALVELIGQWATEVDLVVVGLVPLTAKLNTEDEKAIHAFAHGVRQRQPQLPVILAVEGGARYEPYRQLLRQQGLLVFSTMEQVVDLFVV